LPIPDYLWRREQDQQGDRDPLIAGDCGNLPCKMVADSSSNSIPHHTEITADLSAIWEMGVDAWLIHERDKFACSCGKRPS
jgi:hypothetical protein